MRPLAPLALALAATTAALPAQSARRWKAHDPERPRPLIVAPADVPGGPPADAIVLFDGRSLDQWTTEDGSAPGWTVRDGYMETAPGAGALRTRRGFGDVQLHLEWATPAAATGDGQGRGNSGVILMGRYEVQVLDSYGNTTYADGQAGALYGQYPPLVNASRPPGAWQAYDIVFRRPRFDPNGRLQAPARVTVLHNGVLVQDAEPLWGPTDWLQHREYRAHPDTLPLVLQDHANPVRYRNVWVRPLGDVARPGGLAASAPALRVPAAALRRLEGAYVAGDRLTGRVVLRDGTLHLLLPGDPGKDLVLVPVAPGQFTLRHTAGRVDFAEADGAMTVRLRFAEVDWRAVRAPASR